MPTPPFPSPSWTRAFSILAPLLGQGSERVDGQLRRASDRPQPGRANRVEAEILAKLGAEASTSGYLLPGPARNGARSPLGAHTTDVLVEESLPGRRCQVTGYGRSELRLVEIRRHGDQLGVDLLGPDGDGSGRAAVRGPSIARKFPS